MPGFRTDVERLDARLRVAAHRLAVGGVILLLIQAFTIVADAMARWLADAPIHGMEDVNGLLIAVTVTSFMPALFIERGNITVNLVGRAAGRRPSAWMDAFGHLLAFVFIVVLAWQYIDYAVDLQGQYTVILEAPKWPAALLAGLLLATAAVLQTLVLVVAFLRALAGGVDDGAESAQGEF